MPPQTDGERLGIPFAYFPSFAKLCCARAPLSDAGATVTALDQYSRAKSKRF